MGEVQRSIFGPVLEFLREGLQRVEPLASDVRGRHMFNNILLLQQNAFGLQNINPSNPPLFLQQSTRLSLKWRECIPRWILARIIIMLGKASTFASLTRSLHRLFSTSGNGKREQKVQGMREADYSAKRKTTMQQFDSQLVKEKKLHNQFYQGYERDLAAARSDTEYDRVEERYDEFMSDYYKRIEGLNVSLKKQLGDIDHEEKTDIVKLYLLDNLPEDPPTINNSSKDALYIPNGLVLKKLYHGSKSKAKELHPSRQILLAGVEKDEEHSLFLSRLVDEMGVKNIVTMVSPDLPYFIKTERSYLQEWAKFLQNNDYARKCKFYLNPQPKTLEDICLQAVHIPLVKRGLARSRTFLESYYSMQQENDITQQYEPAPLLTGMLSQGVSRIYFGNYPAYEERRMIADLTPLPRLRELFQLHLSNYRAGKVNFSAQWLFPQEVLSRKLAHIVAVTRAAVDSTNERTMVICPAEMAELLAIQWQVGRNGMLSYNYQDRHYYLNLAHKMEGAEEQSFVEFIEKLVILDLLTEPIFTRYFVKYRSFPFLCEHTIGGSENVGKIFAVWMHFYNTYYGLLGEKRLDSPEVAQQRKEYMGQFEHPTDFT